jgi:hypothetical protein
MWSKQLLYQFILWFFFCIKFEVHYLCISSDSLISRVCENCLQTHLPDGLKLFAVQKESDLFTSDTTATEGDSEENSEEIFN